MPNIEIHGLPDYESARPVEEKIWDALSGCLESFLDEVVVTRYTTVVSNRKGVPQPFLRIFASADQEFEYIEGRLKSLLNMDIEAVLLHRWTPKKKEL